MSKDWNISDDYEVIESNDEISERINEAIRLKNQSVRPVLSNDGLQLLRARRTDRYRRSIRQTGKTSQGTLQRDRASSQNSDHD